MAITLIQTTSNFSSTMGSLSATFASPVTAGNFILIWCTSRDAQTYLKYNGLPATDFAAANYSYGASTGVGYRVHVSYQANINGGTGTVSSANPDYGTSQWGPNPGDHFIAAAEFSGVSLSPAASSTQASISNQIYSAAQQITAPGVASQVGALLFSFDLSSDASGILSPYTSLPASSRQGDSAGYKISTSSATQFASFQHVPKSMSFNFVGGGSGGSTGQAVSATTFAGIIQAGNWKNLTGSSGSATLVDQSGNTTTATVTYSAPSTSNLSTSIAHNTGNAQVMFGYLASTSTSGQISLTVNGLDTTVSSYDLYVYLSDAATGNSAQVTVRSNTSSFTTVTRNYLQGSTYSDSSSFSEAADNGPSIYNTGNYVHFTGIKGNNFSISIFPNSWQSLNYNAGLAGVQIVPTGSNSHYGVLTASFPSFATTRQSLTQTGNARIKARQSRTQPANARILVHNARTQSGNARIKIRSSRTQTGNARIKLQTKPIITGNARIKRTATRTQTGQARIQARQSRSQTGKAFIYYRPRLNQSANARIQISQFRTIAGKARIYVTRKRIVPANARIRVTSLRPIVGQARVNARALRAISGTARLKTANARNLFCGASIRVATSFAGIGSTDRILSLKPKKTLSQLIEAQLPAFVRDDYSQFIAFLQAYYEWLEENGIEIYSGKVTATSRSTITLASDASTSTVEYLGKFIAIENGPAKGHTRQIVGYDPNSFTITVYPDWDQINVPPPNTMASIRDRAYPDRLLEYADVDSTLDKFIQHFRNTYISRLPGSIIANPRHVLKHIKGFNQARGTEDSYRFLFRILFGQEIEFYYPKTDLFRASASRWVNEQVMRIATGRPYDWTSRQIVGTSSGATAVVESSVQTVLEGSTVTELTLSNVRGTFRNDPVTGVPELVQISYPYIPPAQSALGAASDLLEVSTVVQNGLPYSILTAVKIINPGSEYEVGDLVTATVLGGSPAKASVLDVAFTTYNGRVNATATVSSTQVALAPQESAIADFFVGCELTITAGTGIGQRGVITDYNGTTKVATLNATFDTAPDLSSEYTIIRNRGGIKAIQISDVGLGVTSGNVTFSIQSQFGSGAVLQPVIGCIAARPGFWTSSYAGGFKGLATSPDSFPSSNKVLQDSFYYQEFSYEIRFTQTIDTYRDVVTEILHPAGMKLFGAVSGITSAANHSRLSGHSSKVIQVDTFPMNPIAANPYSELLSGNVENVVLAAGRTALTLNGQNDPIRVIYVPSTVAVKGHASTTASAIYRLRGQATVSGAAILAVIRSGFRNTGFVTAGHGGCMILTNSVVASFWSISAKASLTLNATQILPKNGTITISAAATATPSFTNYAPAAISIAAQASVSAAGTYASLAPTAVTFVQKNSSIGSNNTSLSVPFTSNNKAGNAIVAFVRVWTPSNIPTLSDTKGNVYTRTATIRQTTDDHQIYIFTAYNVPAGANTVTVTYSGQELWSYLAIHEFSGVATAASPVDNVVTATSGSTQSASVTVGPVTTSSCNDFLFIGVGTAGNYPGSYSDAGWTLGSTDDITANGWHPAAVIYKGVDANTPYSTTVTLDSAQYWSAIMLSLKPSYAPAGCKASSVSVNAHAAVSATAASIQTINIVQRASAYNSGIGNVATNTFTNPIKAGNYVIAWVSIRDAQEYVRDTNNNIFVDISRVGYNIGSSRMHLHTCYFGPYTGSQSIAVESMFPDNFGPVPGEHFIGAIEVSGLNSTPSVVVSSVGDNTPGAVSSINAPSVTANVGDLVLSFVISQDPTSIKTPYTAITGLSNTNFGDSEGYRIAATTGTQTPSFNITTTGTNGTTNAYATTTIVFAKA
jgi:hypothetical protein